MSTPRHHARRLLVATVGLALLGSPLALAGPGAAAGSDPKYRETTSPEVSYPLAGSSAVVDKRNYTAARGFTDISAPCGAAVRSAVAGTATVLTRKHRGQTRYVVRVQTATAGTWIGSAYLAKPAVRTGDVVASGQRLGRLLKLTGARTCKLQFKVNTARGTVDPSVWLARHVGEQLAAPPAVPPAQPTTDAPGFTLASFNILGANHTRNSKVYATYPSRFKRAMALLDERGVDVAGLQEMQREQADYFVSEGYSNAWGIYHFDPPGPARDTDNAIIFRKSTMELVQGHTFGVPYFYGTKRAMPAVMLREKATGRTAWFVNVHNPASSKARGDHAVHRAEAVRLELQKVSELLTQRRPVFLVGDFNDSELAYCAATRNDLMFSPAAPRSTNGQCNYSNRFSSIDWIFAAGDVTFSNFNRDKTPRLTFINDHPIILATAFLGS